MSWAPSSAGGLFQFFDAQGMEVEADLIGGLGQSGAFVGPPGLA
ncbi:MAG: hypothetical protein WDN06_02275 [Asticcacaulis sp.]